MRRVRFKPKKGQVDYTHARFAPSLNCAVQYRGRILIVRRSRTMRLYPGYWNGIGGFLDDAKTLEEKTYEELKEELGIPRKNIISLKPGKVFDLKEPKYQKVWLIYPVLAKVKSDKIKLDWEAEEYRWVKPQEAKKFKLAPGFQKVLQQLFLVSDGRQIQEKSLSLLQ